VVIKQERVDALQEPKEEPAKEDAATAPVTYPEIKPRLFFGDNNCYVFFRFYQVIYERLFKARELAKASQENFTATATAVAAAAPTFTENSIIAAAVADAKRDLYTSFLKSVQHLIAGNIESSKFEDDCRAALGVSSYVFFTLDRHIVQLTKHIYTMVQSPTQSLLSLYLTEGKKSEAGHVTSNYLSAALKCVASDDTLYKFEFESGADGGKLTMKLVDQPSTPSLPAYDKEKWSKYVDNYVQSDGTSLDVRKHRIFLQRNQKRTKKLGDKIVSNVEVVNGLECRICLNTYRLFYVQDTEDYFF
jgi:paired amphipathic helix protein Sin3a